MGNGSWKARSRVLMRQGDAMIGFAVALMFKDSLVLLAIFLISGMLCILSGGFILYRLWRTPQRWMGLATCIICFFTAAIILFLGFANYWGWR
jgi:hypothetical protein